MNDGFIVNDPCSVVWDKYKRDYNDALYIIELVCKHSILYFFNIFMYTTLRILADDDVR
jgi:hypothetical protein